MSPLPFRIQVVGHGGAIQIFVAIHGVVTTDESGELANAQFFHVLLQLPKERLHTFRRNVAAVTDGVYVDFCEALFFGEVEQREGVANIGVNSLIGNHAENVKGGVFLCGVGGGGEQGFLFEEASVLNCVVNLK